jgi:hypothetical protein
MGDLLAFRQQSRATCNPRADLAVNSGEGAEILFFTGVRFVRFEDYPERPKRQRGEPGLRARRRERKPA